MSKLDPRKKKEKKSTQIGFQGEGREPEEKGVCEKNKKKVLQIVAKVKGSGSELWEAKAPASSATTTRCAERPKVLAF